MPYTLYDYPNKPINETEIFKFMGRGGTVIWVGDTPFYYVDKNGVKEEIFSKGNPFPFVPKNFELKPMSKNSENTIVGEILEYRIEFSDASSTRIGDARILLIYSSNANPTVTYEPSILRKVTELLSAFDPNIFYVYLSAGNELRVLFNDKTDVSINELGYGYKSLLNFILSYVVYQPKIILIDDLEGFALHPELLKQFYDFLLKLDVDLILITTQSSDVYAYLAEKRSDNVRFILINDGKYEVLSSEEVLDRMDYEDLRYTALKISNEVH
ncbi:MAG: AAA family ATPase [Sulfolobus sp.]